MHPDGRDIVAHRFILTNAISSQMDTTLPASLPIPTFNLITRKTVSDPGLWNTVLRYPASLSGVALTPANATNLAQLQSLSAIVLGGTNGAQTLGQLQAQFTNNTFSYTLQWSGLNWQVQELGWSLQMPSNCDHFSWDRAARWTVYPATDIGRATGTATPSTTNADYSRMDLPNAFDFNSTKYDCNWASLASAQGAGLRVEFDPQQRFHCRAGGVANGAGYLLFANQQVSVPNDFTQPVVPDLIMTLSSGNVVQGSFRIGSVAAGSLTSSNTIASITNIMPLPSNSVGGHQFGLVFNALSNQNFSVWASTNLVSGHWEWEGTAAQISSGQYRFFDHGSTNAPYRFYRISTP